MNEPDSTDPQGSNAILRRLQTMGFEILNDSRGGMGGAAVLLAEAVPFSPPRAYLRLQSELGRSSIGLRFDLSKAYRTPAEWLSLIHDRPIQTSDLATDLEFLEASINQARRAYTTTPHVDEAMAARGTEYMKRTYPSLSQYFQDKQWVGPSNSATPAPSRPSNPRDLYLGGVPAMSILDHFDSLVSRDLRSLIEIGQLRYEKSPLSARKQRRSLGLRTATADFEILLWESGEAEFGHGTAENAKEEHHQVTSPAELDRLLGQFIWAARDSVELSQ